ncbi:Asp23/Gls24 family envelope stress response protein [Lentilactobacillus kefiri]|nr:Asp23/Gls24 family envelope stress response protein [Lentilactobacillus kefiri]MCJ2161961.1 Asp23/Gls24 family envelope stress response protein [Lentilactobacillus kefiri]MCP9369057.1 Asp23/Gls24 family envelope stress response protein [Lentilactobacillus kefiri]MDM7493820.1 Asp23/Gls24 family envelope stress response protein [Lentilactobacillus kefiri]PAK59480.1 Asp23/Gls24 family envelope stress response protein [Lentilactobacillus kefiri]PAK82890.1 Asp23/Gls24 family envelope stress resp
MTQENNNSVETVLTYEDDVLTKIVGNTVRDVDGVLSLEGGLIDSVTDKFSDETDPSMGVKVDLDNDDKEVKISMDAILEYGKSIPLVFKKIISKLSQTISDMTDLKPTEIKINVKDLQTREEFMKKNSKGDKKKDK